jgi:hypothetical protein
LLTTGTAIDQSGAECKVGVNVTCPVKAGEWPLPLCAQELRYVNRRIAGNLLPKFSGAALGGTIARRASVLQSKGCYLTGLKAWLRSKFATRRPRTTPVTVEKR